MRTAAFSLLLLASPVVAQEVTDCDEVPPVTSLVEPWEETSVALGAGAIRLALLHGAGEEGVKLLVLTLPPVEDEAPGEAPGPEEAEDEAPQVEASDSAPRHCRIVTEGGLGFAALDVGAVEVEEDPEAATLTARVPVLRFVPESTELEELTLSLTFGVRDDSLTAVVEGDEPASDGEAAEAASEELSGENEAE